MDLFIFIKKTIKVLIIFKKHGFQVVLSRGGTSVESGGRVCDGRWHAAAARVWRAGLSLSLDGAPPERAAPALIAPAAPPTGNSLYVAGLPG